MSRLFILAERYVVERPIGEGATATVYAGTDRLLQRRVAIKVLRPHFALDEHYVQRFYREAEGTRELDHRNIVTTYDFGRQDDTYYIVREYVDGRSLREILDDEGRLPEPLALHYAEQILRGLSAAHARGMLHRDVKPENILVSGDGVAKISDFGVARWNGQQTLASTNMGQVFGSVAYMAPEQVENKALGPAADLYGLGVVMYEMLAGELPYTGTTLIGVALQHLNAPVPSLEDRVAGLSDSTASMVERLLQKDPNDRFGSASQALGEPDGLEELDEAHDDAATVMMDAIAQATRKAPAAKRPKPPALSQAVVSAPPVQSQERRIPTLAIAIVVLACCVIAIALAGRFSFRNGAPKTLAATSPSASAREMAVRVAPKPAHNAQPLRTSASLARAVATARPSPDDVATPATSPAPAATPSPAATAARAVPTPRATQRPTASPTAVPTITIAQPQSIVRTAGALQVFSTPACTDGDAGIAVSGFATGCTNYAAATSGMLSNGAGAAIVVPVAQQGDPNNVQYGLLYFEPRGSTSPYFLGLLPGDGSGHLIVRVQNGVLIEQNGDRIKHSTFDGRSMLLVDRNY